VCSDLEDGKISFLESKEEGNNGVEAMILSFKSPWIHLKQDSATEHCGLLVYMVYTRSVFSFEYIAFKRLGTQACVGIS